MEEITVDMIRDNCIGERSKGIYGGYQKRFLEFFRIKKTELVGEDGHVLDSVLSSEDFVGHFQEFLITQKHHVHPNMLAGISTMRSFRSAMGNYFSIRKVTPHPNYQERLKTFFQ